MRHISDMGYTVDRYLPDEELRASTGPIDSLQFGDHGQYVEDLKAILYPLALKPNSAGKFPILEIRASNPAGLWSSNSAVPPNMVLESSIAANGQPFGEPLFSGIPQERPSLQHSYFWDVKDASIDGDSEEQNMVRAFSQYCQRRYQDMRWFDEDSKTIVYLYVSQDGLESSPESGPESTSPAGSPGSSENSGPHVRSAEDSIPPGTESKIPTTMRTDADLAAILPDLQFWASSHKPKRPNQVLSFEHGTEPEKEYQIRGDQKTSSLTNPEGEADQ
ncbi:uncharacterized protein MKK02DRAFT_39836 [Dioszegia hungarica]|uniref:Uncharacterized protein n=1 Tax=Dioszegia hungarica TaxID=4972 RepID=A0AA38HG98_9TREE|nr:uncharacterized protein MKK02DRAFT_39836 [Dioszegia hungarica]KAI9639528.1 hypothetical protein MKK02DRAFT_39836 [Dioszegia hungarica]